MKGVRNTGIKNDKPVFFSSSDIFQHNILPKIYCYTDISMRTNKYRYKYRYTDIFIVKNKYFLNNQSFCTNTYTANNK